MCLPGTEAEHAPLSHPGCRLAADPPRLTARPVVLPRLLPTGRVHPATLLHTDRAAPAAADAGGRRRVVLDPPRGGGGIDIFGFVLSGSAQDVSSVNLLLEPHDLAFSNDYLYNVLQNEGNFRNVFLSPGEPADLTGDLSQAVFYAAPPG